MWICYLRVMDIDGQLTVKNEESNLNYVMSFLKHEIVFITNMIFFLS